MSHTPHELAEEFPDLVDKIHTLKTSDAHFARLSDEYHEVNRAIHRAETKVEPVSDSEEESLRKTRMVLKDKLYGMLKAVG
ncbi:MAG: YdcH family protein [Pseudomonadota bacterium]